MAYVEKYSLALSWSYQLTEPVLQIGEDETFFLFFDFEEITILLEISG